MRRSVGIYILTLSVLLPLGWLAATTEEFTTRTVLMLGGGAITAGLLLRFAWQAHQKGKLLPNRCRTCDSAMSLTVPGELKPPPGVETSSGRVWRCRRCGRLE